RSSKRRRFAGGGAGSTDRWRGRCRDQKGLQQRSGVRRRRRRGEIPRRRGLRSEQLSAFSPAVEGRWKRFIRWELDEHASWIGSAHLKSLITDQVRTGWSDAEGSVYSECKGAVSLVCRA